MYNFAFNFVCVFAFMCVRLCVVYSYHCSNQCSPSVVHWFIVHLVNDCFAYENWKKSRKKYTQFRSFADFNPLDRCCAAKTICIQTQSSDVNSSLDHLYQYAQLDAMFIHKTQQRLQNVQFVCRFFLFPLSRICTSAAVDLLASARIANN